MTYFVYTVNTATANPRWVNASQTLLDISVTFERLGSTVRYTAARSDPGFEHSEEIFERAVSGEFGPVAPYVAPLEPVSQEISRRQCARQMRIQSMISNAEMLAMVQNGTPPAMVQAIFNAIPNEDTRFAALADFAAGTYRRDNSLLISVIGGTVAGATPEAIDEFFRRAGKL